MTYKKQALPSHFGAAAWFLEGDLGSRTSTDRIKIRSEVFAEWLGFLPEALSYVSGPYDKPRMIVKNSGTNEFFEICTAHAEEKMVLAISRDLKVGVDIFSYENDFDSSLIVEECFSSAEREYLNRLSVSDQTIEFGRLWSRKEAVIKCLGLGLQIDLGEFEVLSDRVMISALPLRNGQEALVEVKDLSHSSSCHISMACAHY
jgi:phosphopantetheine--protein transferase-like protein